MLARFRQRAKKDPGRGSTASDLHRAAEAWCSRTGNCRPKFQHGFGPFYGVLQGQSGVILAAPILFSTVAPFVVCRG